MGIDTAKQYIEVGDPRTVIPELIKQYAIDLLIVGHHERKGIYRIIGSTAYALLAHAKCEILVIPNSSY